MLACSAALLVVSLVLFRLSPAQAAVLAPVGLGIAGSVLTLLSLRARERAERGSG